MEQRHLLASLFDPASVALIDAPPGAQPAWRDALVAALRAQGIAYATRTVGEDAADTSPGDAARAELAIAAVAADAVPQALETAARLQARAVVLPCGFVPASAYVPWVAQARDARMRLLGPGTLGFVRPPRRLNVGLLGPMPPSGSVALVSQSGALGGAVLDWAVQGATGFSLIATLGSEADVDIGEVLDFLAVDGDTRAVVIYLEAVRDPRRFLSALRGLAAAKPVVVLKGRRDERTPRKPLTHAGAVVGSNAAYAAAFRRAGAVQIRLSAQVYTAARYLAARAAPIGARLGIASNGSGAAVLACDHAAFNGQVSVPALSADTQQRLAQQLPHVAPLNPLDLGRDADGAALAAALQALAEDPGIDALLAIVTPHAGVPLDALAAALVEAQRTLHKPLFACLMGEHTVHARAQAIDAAGVPVFTTPEAAVDAFATLASFHANQALSQQVPLPLSGLATPDVAGAQAIVRAALHAGAQVLGEIDSKRVLAAFNVPVTETRLAADANDAVAIAERLGYPVVLKIASPDIVHKSDVGGVVLSVRNADEVRTQHADMLARVRAAQPQARIDGVTVQPMRRARHDRELYVGVVRDAVWGPVISFGAGGTRIEVMSEPALEFPPLNGFLARRLVDRARVRETLGEFRGAPAVDFEALERVLVSISDMVCELPEIAEMDVNPLMVDEAGAVAVDARIAIARAPSRGGRYGHMAILPYPAELAERGVARDGTHYLLRPIRPEDAANLQRLMHELSPQTRYFRFVSAISELPPRMLARYTQIDYDREVALVAIVPSEAAPARTEPPVIQAPVEPAPAGSAGERIVGVVRYLLNPDRESAEFAIVVADDWQGRGLGSRMMTRIVGIATERGLRELVGYVLGSNRTMLTMMQHLGFAIRIDPDDATMRVVVRALAKPAGDTR